MVEEIEEFGAVLEPPALAKSERFVGREIDVEGRRADQDVAPGIPESTELGRSERRGVEPFRDSGAEWPACIAQLANYIGEVIANSSERPVVVRNHVERKSALPVPNG